VDASVPDIAIFIDGINEDLQDMADALNATVRIFEVQKYSVNGNIEYLSPQGRKTVFETTVEDVTEIQNKPSSVIEALGGGRLVSNVGKINIFELDTGEIVATKYSKYYESDNYYWYGLTPATLDK